LVTGLTATVLLTVGAVAADANAAPFCRGGRMVGSHGGEDGPHAAQGFAAHLAVAPGPIVAGHPARMRIVNEGAGALSFEVGAHGTQRWVGGSWISMPPPSGGARPPVVRATRPGSVSRCVGPPTEPNWPAGKYRWSLPVTVQGTDGRHRHLLRATFRVRSKKTTNRKRRRPRPTPHDVATAPSEKCSPSVTSDRVVAPEPAKASKFPYTIDRAGEPAGPSGGAGAPIIFSEGGSLAQASNERQIESNDTQALFITAFAPEGVAKIQFIINGSTVVDEKTCTGSAADCEYESLEWYAEPEDLPVGTMWIEVVLSSRVEVGGEPLRSSARWWVTVPYVPPPQPGIPQPPKYKQVLEFREAHGLDLDLDPVADEHELHIRVWEGIDAWFNPSGPGGQVANETWERWGVPLRYPDEQVLEYREAFLAWDAPSIHDWAKAHAWNAYGGYYMDERAGGLLRVGFTERQAELVAQMKTELGGRLADLDRITAFPTPPTITIASLEAARRCGST
jgi:hypothetical protein